MCVPYYQSVPNVCSNPPPVMKLLDVVWPLLGNSQYLPRGPLLPKGRSHRPSREASSARSVQPRRKHFSSPWSDGRCDAGQCRAGSCLKSRSTRLRVCNFASFGDQAHTGNLLSEVVDGRNCSVGIGLGSERPEVPVAVVNRSMHGPHMVFPYLRLIGHVCY